MAIVIIMVNTGLSCFVVIVHWGIGTSCWYVPLCIMTTRPSWTSLNPYFVSTSIPYSCAVGPNRETICTGGYQWWSCELHSLASPPLPRDCIQGCHGNQDRSHWSLMYAGRTLEVKGGLTKGDLTDFMEVALNYVVTEMFVMEIPWFQQVTIRGFIEDIFVWYLGKKSPVM